MEFYKIKLSFGMIEFESKLKSNDISIFAEMSALANKHKAINLGQGFPNFDCAQELKNRVAHYLQGGKNQYCPMPGLIELRNVLSDKIEFLYGRKLSADDEITITAGATQAIFTAISAFVNGGDEVILIEPAYDSYRPSIELMGGKVVAVTLRAPDYQIDWTEVKSKITDRTKMMIINTPQNPIGKVLSKDDMIALSEVLAGTNVILLSDEVYEHLVFDHAVHESALKFDGLWERCLSVYSFGKTFHSTGWKMGYIVGSKHLMDAFRNVHQWNVYCVNSFLQYALADFLKEKNHYLELGSFYQKKRDLFNKQMLRSKLKPLISEGTYFQLYEYSAVSDLDDRAFAKWLTTTHGVASIPLSPFYSEVTSDRVVRFCFAKTDDVLLAAADRLSQI